MTSQETEDLFIRSFDLPLSIEEKEQLIEALRVHPGLATDIFQYKNIRAAALKSRVSSFGPHFTKKVITKIQNLGIEIDRQIGVFFKKYQLAVLGVLIALLAVNVIFSDQINIQSVLGIEDSTVTTDEILSFDFYENLNN